MPASEASYKSKLGAKQVSATISALKDELKGLTKEVFPALSAADALQPRTLHIMACKPNVHSEIMLGRLHKLTD